MNKDQEQIERRQRHVREEMERRRRDERLQDVTRHQRERYQDQLRQDRFHRETLAVEKRNSQSISRNHQSISADSSTSSESSIFNEALTLDDIETDVEQIKEAFQNFVQTGLICVPIIGILYLVGLFLDGPLIKPAIFIAALFPAFYMLIAAWNIMAIIVKVTLSILAINGLIYLIWWGLGIPGLEYISLPVRWIFRL